MFQNIANIKIIWWLLLLWLAEDKVQLYFNHQINQVRYMFLYPHYYIIDAEHSVKDISQVQGLSTSQENELNCICFNFNTSHNFSVLAMCGCMYGWVWKGWKLKSINKTGSFAFLGILHGLGGALNQEGKMWRDEVIWRENMVKR